MKLFGMSEAEYAFWVQRATSNYAQDKKRANGYTESEAQKVASEDFQRLLPEGLKSKDQFLYAFKDDQGTLVGQVWFGIKKTASGTKAFVYDVVIEESFRGKGFGRKMMQLLETEIRKTGATAVGLHVFGFNVPAIELYKSLGYVTTDLVMEKPL